MRGIVYKRERKQSEGSQERNDSVLSSIFTLRDQHHMQQILCRILSQNALYDQLLSTHFQVKIQFSKIRNNFFEANKRYQLPIILYLFPLRVTRYLEIVYQYDQIGFNFNKLSFRRSRYIRGEIVFTSKCYQISGTTKPYIMTFVIRNIIKFAEWDFYRQNCG